MHAWDVEEAAVIPRDCSKTSEGGLVEEAGELRPHDIGSAGEYKYFGFDSEWARTPLAVSEQSWIMIAYAFKRVSLSGYSVVNRL